MFSEIEKQRHSELMQKLKDATIETIETANGFTFLLKPELVAVTEVAEWINYERHCCSFFNFQIEIHAEDPRIRLQLYGGTKVKEFLRPDVEQNTVFDPKF
ncbi:MAG TPA: hypothetical protein VGK36_02585 [Candidatus Angelobacter sp.]